MFPYYLRLAFGSFRRNPGLTALMIMAIALGIALCLITLAGYRAAANNTIAPESIIVRATTRDFFEMFETPFLYGNGWTTRADQGPEPVIVLSKAMNERAFK